MDFVDTGMPPRTSFYGAASPPGCFTCHKPHISGDFSLRKVSSETLVDGTNSFNGGNGQPLRHLPQVPHRVGSTYLAEHHRLLQYGYHLPEDLDAAAPDRTTDRRRIS